MKTKRAVSIGIAVILLVFATVVTFIRVLGPAQPPELTIDEAVNRIRSGQIKEITFRQAGTELIDRDQNKYSTQIDSDPKRELLLRALDDFNKENSGRFIKMTMEPASSGFVWLLLLNGLPFYIMWGITLAVIVYAVTVLSKK